MKVKPQVNADQAMRQKKSAVKGVQVRGKRNQVNSPARLS